MSKSCSVLMVDDNPADGEMVRRYLEDVSLGRELDFDQALSAEEALDALRDGAYDVLLIDYHFPFGNGFDILRRLREAGVDTPAVMLTGQGSEEIAGRAVSESLSGYLPKPQLSPSSLEGLLESALSGDTGGADASRASNRPDTEADFPGPVELLSDVSRILGESGWSLLFVRLEGIEPQSDGVLAVLIDGLFTHFSGQMDVRPAFVHPVTVGTTIESEDVPSLNDTEYDDVRKSLQSRLTEIDEFGDYTGTLGVNLCVHSLDDAGPDPAAAVNDGLDRLLTTGSEDSGSRTLRLFPEE